MTVDAISGSAHVNTNNEPIQAAFGKTLNENDFMKIFMKQMTMQSPDKPLDSGQMMQQMSQLTALESNKSLKKAIDEMNRSIGQSQVMSATQMIGKHVLIESDRSPLTAKDGLKGSVVALPGMKSVSVNISDSMNHVVKSMNLPVNEAGIIDFAWDGRNEAGEPMREGIYNISAKGLQAGNERKLPTAGYYRVDSVTMNRQTSEAMLDINGMGGVTMNDVIKFLG